MSMIVGLIAAGIVARGNDLSRGLVVYSAVAIAAGG